MIVRNDIVYILQCSGLTAGYLEGTSLSVHGVELEVHGAGQGQRDPATNRPEKKQDLNGYKRPSLQMNQGEGKVLVSTFFLIY